jgi:DNA-binding transcriptional MerR regulator
MTLEIDIGEVVEQTGVPVSTLHVWEREGLLTPTGRRGLRRQYSPDVIGRVAMIVVGQRAGFSLADIKTLLDPKAFARDGKAAIEAKLGELRAHRDQLDAAITGLEHAAACPYDVPTDCPTFNSMLDEVLPVER